MFTGRIVDGYSNYMTVRLFTGLGREDEPIDVLGLRARRDDRRRIRVLGPRRADRLGPRASARRAGLREQHEARDEADRREREQDEDDGHERQRSSRSASPRRADPCAPG